MINILIFTDLDGSLLNYEDYSFDETVPIMERITRPGMHPILTTSKSCREAGMTEKLFTMVRRTRAFRKET